MHIEFLCSRVVGVPVFLKETADCVHHFSWETPVSCPSLVIEQWTDLIEFKLVCLCVDWGAWRVTYVTVTAFIFWNIELNLNFFKIQFVLHSKHTPSQLQKPVS
jgi:hypothetical protein